MKKIEVYFICFRYAEPYLSYYLQSHSKLKQRWPDLWQFIDSVNSSSPAGMFPYYTLLCIL